jgi:tetratricopeptide (TPR) repeat protein
MLKPKKKVTKQELKEDKFVKFSLQAKSYFDENYQKLMRVALGIAAIIIISVFYYYNSQETAKEANSQLGIAEIEYTNGNMAKASERLVRLIEEYDGTDSADKGMFLLANIYYQQKKYDDARIYFDRFVDAYSGSNILLASGYAGLAACEEVGDNYSEAADLYEQAADLAPDFPESDNYYYLSALCYKRAGDLDKARSIFEQLANEAKSSQRVKDAETQLVLLGKE